jgi:excisionase family DNA binding protein
MKASDAQFDRHEFLTVPEVKKLLNVSRASVYRLKDSGFLPFYKILGTIRFRRSDVETYLQTCRSVALNEDEYVSSKAR